MNAVSASELLKILIGGLAGGSLALSGTMLTLRHQRRLAAESWFRERQIDAVAEVLAAVNHFSRAVGENRHTYDSRWVALADSIGRAGLVLIGDEPLQALRNLSRSAKSVLDHQQLGEPKGFESTYWVLMNKVWSDGQKLTESIRMSLKISSGESFA